LPITKIPATSPKAVRSLTPEQMARVENASASVVIVGAVPQRVTMSNYHLTYSKIEDRVFLWTDQGQHGVALTRRMTRGLLAAMTNAIAQQKSTPAVANEVVRNAVLGFEHAKAVTEAYANGKTRRHTLRPPDPGISKIATAIDITARKAGGVSLTFKHSQGVLLSLNLDSPAAYVFTSSMCEIAGSAEWGFNEIAAWLDSTPPQEKREPSTTALH
jgi:hypothetical protein